MTSITHKNVEKQFLFLNQDSRVKGTSDYCHECGGRGPSRVLLNILVLFDIHVLFNIRVLFNVQKIFELENTLIFKNDLIFDFIRYLIQIRFGGENSQLACP